MKKKIILWIVLLLPYFGLYYVWHLHRQTVAGIENATVVIISKEDMKLSVYDYKGKQLSSYPMACGKNYGNKEVQGDLKTPEGVFSICDIQDASTWSHDFGDGKGKIEGAYGPFFIRLLTPGHKGIGIHGTHDNNSLGTRATEGCIRLKNQDLLSLLNQVKVGTVVIVLASRRDMIRNL